MGEGVGQRGGEVGSESIRSVVGRNGSQLWRVSFNRRCYAGVQVKSNVATYILDVTASKMNVREETETIFVVLEPAKSTIIGVLMG